MGSVGVDLLLANRQAKILSLYVNGFAEASRNERLVG
jgi:hypothetical protein